MDQCHGGSKTTFYLRSASVIAEIVKVNLKTKSAQRRENKAKQKLTRRVHIFWGKLKMLNNHIYNTIKRKNKKPFCKTEQCQGQLAKKHISCYLRTVQWIQDALISSAPFTIWMWKLLMNRVLLIPKATIYKLQSEKWTDWSWKAERWTVVS